MGGASDDLASLRRVSARIGADPLLVQGPGGNISQKIGGVLWVKASGRWLSEASEAEIFAPLSLDGVRRRLAEGRADGLDAEVLEGMAPAGLRPSIETALHALLPHAVVIHAHAVNSMTVAVLADGESRAQVALEGLAWRWIAYRRPGEPLARAIAEALAGDGPVPAVLLLQNHGVVVGAETPDAAEELLRTVEHRLAQAVGGDDATETSGGGADDPAEIDGYEPLAAWSAVVSDPHRVEALCAAPLIPDQVVFLGGAVPRTSAGERLAEAVARVRDRSGIAPALVFARDGAYGARGRSGGADSVLEGLLQIARRLPPGVAVRGLSSKDAAALLGWDAERYRQTLDRERSV